MLASGELTLSAGDDQEAQRRALLALPGVGPWTADYVGMRVTGAPDIMLSGDAAIRNGAKRLGLPSTPAALADWSRRIAPWRSYLTAHLWHVPATGSAQGPGQAHDTTTQPEGQN